MVVHVGDELLNYPLAFPPYNNTLTSKVQQDSNVLYLVVGPTSINDRVLQARKTTTKTIQGPQSSLCISKPGGAPRAV